MSGESPFKNERGMSISKYNAFANMIDIDGDHYGFVRRLRGPQDAMNQHRSKAIHIMNTRQLKIQEGSGRRCRGHPSRRQLDQMGRWSTAATRTIWR